MTTTLTAVFDGSTPVETLGDSREWFDGFLGYYSVFHGVEDDLFRARVTLSGSDWTVKTLRFGATSSNETIIRDADDGSDRRIDLLELGYNSDVELISTRVRYVMGWDGDKHVLVLGDKQAGSVSSINLYARENVVTTGNAWVQSLDTGGPGAIGDSIRIGSGGAGTVDTGDGADRVVTGSGYVGAIWTHDGKDTVKTGGGFVEIVHTGDGNDKVTALGGVGTIKTGAGADVVATGGAWVDLISSGSGDDTLRVGKGGAGLIQLGEGDDKLQLKPMAPEAAVTVMGDGGSDTLDFSKFRHGIVFTLDSDGAWQNPAARGGSLSLGGQGYVRETSVENLTGSNKADRLTGDEAGNLLNGRRGNDVLAGGAADDVLIGGGGSDRFIFGADGGTDRVRDYLRSADRLQIADHAGGFDTLTIGDQGEDLRIAYDGGVILLSGRAGLDLGAADFDFI
ncbi:calcium-binding protein [Pseudodonghicola flavimaris]|uniref:Calcium-binding protein n=1 Tax=Pseudodonghicola flavimaris TaxID=3050036 RepID=A0ABT7EVD2_9RHOB|nr:hypothetical protein [Pseudodonghicola flavimaris]MDK3016303.1 hypothetical protein [Pseudodonghicola flavimaris]